MTRDLIVLILFGLIAAAQAGAADERAKKQKGSSKVERAVENTGKALGNTANRAEKKVRKGTTRAANAVDSAGKKTGRWLKEKLD